MHASGRLSPHPESTHPRVKLVNHLTLPPSDVPAVVDWASLIKVWPLYYNDRIGDCTWAGVGHSVQAWTAYSGTEVILPPPVILASYERMTGYNPQTGANDTGCVEQDVLQDLVDIGVDGHKILAFAQVNVKDRDEMKAALHLFGSVYLGINCPQSAQTQFANGQPWDYVPGSPIEGGHCIVMQYMDDTVSKIVSWGAVIEMTDAFWSNYGEEAWVIITQDWVEKNGDTPTGISLQTLLADFQSLTGATPGPSPRHAKPSVWQNIWSWLRKLI